MKYDEINLNVGCPSQKVQEGSFGACLMKEKETVAEIMKVMQQSVSIPCTVKCRLGVDDYDSYEFIREFVDYVSTHSQTKHFIIHARKAFLKGLNPSQNRNIPPLMYDRVYKLRTEFPDIQFTLNGGLKTYEQYEQQLTEHSGMNIMVGRASYENIWMLGDIDRRIYGKDNLGLSRK